MNLIEVCDAIKAEGNYTDENIASLKKAMENEDIKSFQDPSIVKFMFTINTMPFDPRVQDIVSLLVYKASEKGIEAPCGSGCDDTCPFHEIEFGEQNDQN